MEDKDYWLLLLLVMAYGKDPNPLVNLKENINKMDAARQQEQAFRHFQRDCPEIEWEHDMGATIPFCRLTNDICDGHCMKGY